jgi:hypothetical protein
VVLTNEIVVANSLAPRPIFLPDENVDDGLAERLNAVLWELAFSWFRDGDDDPTRVAGISAGDLAGAEAAISIFIPAARGVLDAQVALRQFAPETLTVVAATSEAGHYTVAEQMQAHAFGEAVRQLSEGDLPVAHATSHDPRNELLISKYARVRDPDWLAPGRLPHAIARRAVLAIVGIASQLRPGARRPSLAVAEYGPTRAFAGRYSATAARHFRLVRFWPPSTELVACLRAGDRIVAPMRPRRSHLDDVVRARIRAALERIGDRTGFTLEGVELWPLVGPRLVGVVERYAAFVSAAGGQYVQELRRRRPAAVLVPFDTPPEARLLVRSAQTLGIPTFVVNDGFKGDDFTQEGMTADVALAWSRAIRDGYFRRRRDGTAVVTGNPKADLPAGTNRVSHQDRSRILIGSFTFSPVDLNCRRSDSERFLAEVLEGIRRSRRRPDQVVVKLHPADATDHYREILEIQSPFPVDVVSTGDITGMLDRFDLYITTYSTSLIEAVGLGLPVIYYRVNPQRLHPPFSHDPFLARCTAATPDQVATLLDGPASPFETADARAAWIEQYLGPRDGRSVDRIVAAIREKLATVE